jgi:transposase
MIIKTERDYTRVSDEEWLRLSAKLKTIAGIYVGSDRACRRFIDGVLWILRVGGQWRSLPAERGRWNSVFKRFSRWSLLGVWSQLRKYSVNPSGSEDFLHQAGRIGSANMNG